MEGFRNLKSVFTRTGEGQQRGGTPTKGLPHISFRIGYQIVLDKYTQGRDSTLTQTLKSMWKGCGMIVNFLGCGIPVCTIYLKRGVLWEISFLCVKRTEGETTRAEGVSGGNNVTLKQHKSLWAFSKGKKKRFLWWLFKWSSHWWNSEQCNSSFPQFWFHLL
jgi:hypothetical protein